MSYEREFSKEFRDMMDDITEAIQFYLGETGYPRKDIVVVLPDIPEFKRVNMIAGVEVVRMAELSNRARGIMPRGQWEHVKDCDNCKKKLPTEAMMQKDPKVMSCEICSHPVTSDLIVLDDEGHLNYTCPYCRQKTYIRS